MGNENQDLIEKTVTTGDIAFGGQLTPVQQDEFVKLVKDNSVMLRTARFVQMAISRKLVDKMYVSEPVTAGVGEDDPTATGGRPVFDQIELLADKLKSDWNVSTETLQENIEGGNFEDALMGMMAKRISTDVELLAIQGDSSITGTTPLDRLLKTSDGWDIQTEASHIVDASGLGISKELMATALRRMPEQYLQDPDISWIMSRSLAIDWQESIAVRETAAGDDALRGNTLRPYGIPIFVVPSIPSRLPLTVAQDTPAQISATEFSIYEIRTGTNDVLRIAITIDATRTPATLFVAITLAAGNYTAVELADEIRKKLIASGANGIVIEGGLNIYDDGQGRLVLETKNTDATQAIHIDSVANGSTLNNELGIGAAAINALGATGTGTVNEGSFIWLANPKNFLFGMVDSTRVYTEFNKDRDRIESVIYNQVATNVENTDAIVKIKNVRRGGVV